MSVSANEAHARAPSHTPEFWRAHFDKIKLGSGIAPEALRVDVAKYLQNMSVSSRRRSPKNRKRSKSAIAIPKGTYRRVQKEFLKKWNCSQEWLNTTTGLIEHFGKIPTPSELKSNFYPEEPDSQ